MPYSCQDIRRILISESDDLVCEQSFSGHLERCSICRNMCELEPELEDILQATLPKAVPFSLTDEVMVEIRIDEKKLSPSRLIEKYLPAGAVSLLAIMTAIIIGRWSEFTALISSTKSGSFLSGVASLWQSVELPEINLSEYISAIVNSPMVLLSLIAVTALLWAYSILEFEKSPR